ncbi:MAG: hypothetical protein IPH75_08320 [bacterium]|nr:hypothetical protein [bacterium]
MWSEVVLSTLLYFIAGLLVLALVVLLSQIVLAAIPFHQLQRVYSFLLRGRGAILWKSLRRLIGLFLDDKGVPVLKFGRNLIITLAILLIAAILGAYLDVTGNLPWSGWLK